jgi:hypothetical protein
VGRDPVSPSSVIHARGLLYDSRLASALFKLSAHIVDAVVVIQQGMRPSSVIVSVPAYERLVYGNAPWHGKPLPLMHLPLTLAHRVCRTPTRDYRPAPWENDDGVPPAVWGGEQ